MNPALQDSVLSAYRRADILQEIATQLGSGNKKLSLRSAAGSMPALLAAALFERGTNAILSLFPDRESAAYHYDDIGELLPAEQLFFLPASHRKPYEIEQTDPASAIQRAQVLDGLFDPQSAYYIVTYPAALFEKVITRAAYQKNSLELRLGDRLSPDSLHATLCHAGFRRTDFTTEPGAFSVRGGIVDVFSFSHYEPYRIEFFGDEIASIRSFEVASQLSDQRLERIQVLPDISDKAQFKTRVNFFDCLPAGTQVFALELASVSAAIRALYQRAVRAFPRWDAAIKPTDPQAFFIDHPDFEQSLQSLPVLEFNGAFCKTAQTLAWRSKPQPAFNKKFSWLSENLRENQRAGIRNFLVCSHEKQIQRFADIFGDSGLSAPYEAVVGKLHRGFVDEELQIACYTDHQIFGRYDKSRLKSRLSKSQALSTKELAALKLGDYVTHIDHGVGRFAGLKKIAINGEMREAIKLLYQNDDVLYLSIHALYKISKYKSREAVPPKLNKLGSPAWDKLKQQTKRKAKQLAFDLIQLYAKRKAQKGFAYSPDTYLQYELEASFLFEDTADQSRATRAVKADMESESPMDRLICGDVGFGKTEIAIRAAFKAATDGKQVAVLVPTTILAFQHFRSFSERLAEFPVTVDYLSRFRSPKARRDIVEKTAEGGIDILIGTQQLIGKGIKFHDLGLLIVDEEHKFGVSAKDKLKTLRSGVDTLTLTATPIPRTLQFSLMGARDLSVIRTPPPNRQPIQTEVIAFDESILRDAIGRELDRGGQVFFITDRIETIGPVADALQRLVPDAQIATIHGRMEGRKLETALLGFARGHSDILVSTTLVESGLDVPNANTIFIHHAHRFGLADLHQMRGRVGRSNKKAFCYLIASPPHAITPAARKRIGAIEQLSDLGAGFHIAMADLEIRGAGNILGAEQSGFISDIGFETYQRILNEAVAELRETELKDVYKTEGRLEQSASDVQLDTDFNIHLPDDYVHNEMERLALYCELSRMGTKAEWAAFEAQLVDRFGPLPQETKGLMDSARLKIEAKNLGFVRVVIKKGLFLGYFTQRPAFFQSEAFSKILRQLQRDPKHFELKEKRAKRVGSPPVVRLEIKGVSSLQQALDCLGALSSYPLDPFTAGRTKP